MCFFSYCKLTASSQNFPEMIPNPNPFWIPLVDKRLHGCTLHTVVRKLQQAEGTWDVISFCRPNVQSTYSVYFIYAIFPYAFPSFSHASVHHSYLLLCIDFLQDAVVCCVVHRKVCWSRTKSCPHKLWLKCGTLPIVTNLHFNVD